MIERYTASVVRSGTKITCSFHNNICHIFYPKVSGRFDFRNFIDNEAESKCFSFRASLFSHLRSFSTIVRVLRQMLPFSILRIFGVFFSRL